jgi:peptidoglycan/xylan/chitin deacetylase (PgdA/CDA1 family)
VLRLPLSLLSPAGERGRLSILIFHRVLARPDPLSPDEPDVVEFEAQMRWVRSWFNVLPLGAAIDRLYAGTIPPRALAITFDDGYADNEELAAPILARLGLSATFFISTGYLGGGIMRAGDGRPPS